MEKTRIEELKDLLQHELLGRWIKRSSIFKINSENLTTNGEICFPANLRAWKELLPGEEIEEHGINILEHYLRRKNYETKGLSDEDISKKATDSLIDASETWSLRIEKCSLQRDRVCLFLHRASTIYFALKDAVNREDCYAKRVPVNKSISIKINEDKDSNLTSERLKLVKEVSERLLQLQGFHVVEENADSNYLLTTKSEGKLEEPYHRYVCGVVKNQDSNTKETSYTWETYVEKKIEDLAGLAETKSPEICEKSNPRNIAKAVAIFELLSVKPSKPVFVQTNADPDTTISSSKGGLFVLYNTARIWAIFEKFHHEEMLGNYPKMFPFGTIDFSLLLHEEEEWELVYNFVLAYPDMIGNCVRSESDLELCPQMLCLFLSHLSQKFSAYYRRVRVLTKGGDHLLPTMMARLYLLRALQIVVANSLAILNIEPIGYM